ncbi:hypothetical protein HYE68_007852 [Fusarium pseudograminearum]|uniref:Uncharacterized protein n=2 Tax=Fusarium pseudograminearum TaxID=101028 RepID=K3V4A6_FUSPC|nr:hypothetical protein FPSE_11911 [Fusarium pseudograminearum CS3096]EKJ67902.1 hypothetical protein FPSE_11911 [Fusarium pseudograminearum CS3096]KAF0642583.1 hypothetical protein FPSE5266_11911 [Fusarium pseudograminearum]QPC77100.1 hypothetical protein HYE68_007852 [Fusarium pseudograminearum]CEG02403.1 unnamed protein product [Fusarium pseudograminearum CS3427]
MRFSTFLIAASAALVSARPGFVSTFGNERAALANETAPTPTPGLEDGREELTPPARGEDREDREDRDREEDRADQGREDRDRDGRQGRERELAFGQVDLNYLLQVNQLDLVRLQTLSIKNRFDVNIFADLFAADQFSIKSLLQLQQLSTMLAIAETGIFDQFELSSLKLGDLNLGLIDGIGGIDLTQFIDAATRPKITVIAKQVKVKNTIILAGKN